MGFYIKIEKSLISIFLSSLLFACTSNQSGEQQESFSQLPDKIDYNFHVKPILSDRCFACHGPDAQKREAGLRLDDPIAAFAELPESLGKFAIVKGEPEKSELFHRIRSDDPDQQMPPPESKLLINEFEKAILTQWIEEGAEYKSHWAFMPVQKPLAPTVSHKAWIQNPIDAFILNRLEEAQLSPSPKADKETLIRRLFFDITGLPPNLEQIDAFLADESPNAYEKVVDKLFASEAYGERMASYWMDVARYADSDGYLDDKHRDFSPWRDWVIRSFNQNMAYDKFVSWQLAGDLMPNPSQDQILATAFNRLNKKNSEAGIVFEEYRVEYVSDRTNSFGKAFLGLSLECARCHDHKYDPISQKDYYEVFGFFNQTPEIGHAVYGPDQTPGPALLLTDREARKQIDYLQAKLQRAEKKIADTQKEGLESYTKWAKENPLSFTSIQEKTQAALVSHTSFDKISYTKNDAATTPDIAKVGQKTRLNRAEIGPGIKGNAFYVTDYNSGRLADKIGWYERTQAFTIDLWLKPDTLYPEVSILTHCEDRRLGFKGYSLHLKDNKLHFLMAHSWPQNAIQLTAQNALPIKKWSQVTLSYDGSSKAKGVNIYIDGELQETEVEVDHLYKGILFEYNIHTYGFHGFQFGYRDKFIPFKKGGLDELKIYNRALTELEVLVLTEDFRANQLVEQSEVSLASTSIQEYYSTHHYEPLQIAKDSLYATKEQLNLLYNKIPEIMVMGDQETPRPTFVLNRGSYDDHGEEVQPDVPEKILPFSAAYPRNRLGLVKWLFHPKHPLTARVMANRIWQMYLGRGIVKTAEDFGSQGDLPDHPALLDYLSQYLVDSGWDLKALQKLIVSSATYQQQSHITPELRKIDPDNVLLARGPSFRLPAEMIRDNALAISGLLIQKIGGPSVYPYQPEGLWDEITNKHWRYPYKQEAGEGLYRRSLYTIWKRTAPPPSMQIFDIADRDNCTVRRRNTSTPLQALVLLNDPQYQEAARTMAENLISSAPVVQTRLIASPQKSIAPPVQTRLIASLTRAFRLSTGRTPTQSELAELQTFYLDQQQYYTQHPSDADAYLAIGTDPNTDLPPADVAALAVTINAIMNTDEGYTRR